MDRDEAKARGLALRHFLQQRLPVAGAASVTALANAAGIRPATMSEWWTVGRVPDNASLGLLAKTLGVSLAELVAAYEGPERTTSSFTADELEALLERAARRGAQLALESLRTTPSDDPTEPPRDD